MKPEIAVAAAAVVDDAVALVVGDSAEPVAEVVGSRLGK
jgi:hypothetical protein